MREYKGPAFFMVAVVAEVRYILKFRRRMFSWPWLARFDRDIFSLVLVLLQPTSNNGQLMYDVVYTVVTHRLLYVPPALRRRRTKKRGNDNSV